MLSMLMDVCVCDDEGGQSKRSARWQFTERHIFDMVFGCEYMISF